MKMSDYRMVGNMRKAKQLLILLSFSLFVLIIILHLRFTRILKLSEPISSYGEYESAHTEGSIPYRIDWDNQMDIKISLNRTGLGEAGVPSTIEEYRKQLYDEFGFDALLSDHISVNRLVPDIRDVGCLNIKYIPDLPKTSIIIVCFNERRSVLLRTIHSILNRSPDELLQEIIVVDDFSTLLELHTDLDNYFILNFPAKVRLLRLPQRKGLMGARMVGGRAASPESKVLIFLDSHFEVMYNWLPPLLEPIVLNPKTCTCPVIDTILFDTFRYRKNPGFRGYFQWDLSYLLMNVPKKERKIRTKPYINYVMLGGAFAIGADFFWHLGGFDEGMEIWGGEQYELSFKIWMCGGELIDIPCSRMAHVYRDPNTKGNSNLYGRYEFVNRNYRRLIDVWMDEEHRQYVLDRRPALKTVDPGDLTSRLELRDRLQCKSFTWLMENVMVGIKKKFPPIIPPDYANGVIQSLLDPELCIDDMGGKKIALFHCAANKTNPQPNQNWHFDWHRAFCDHRYDCLDADGKNGKVSIYKCHEGGGNQLWNYDREHKWITFDNTDCIVAAPEEGIVKLAVCDPENAAMRWELGYVNNTAMDQLDLKLNRVVKKRKKTPALSVG